MGTYKNDFTKEEDQMLWELHEIRHKLAEEHKSMSIEDINKRANPVFSVCRERHVVSSGCESHLAIVAPAGSTWSGSRRAFEVEKAEEIGASLTTLQKVEKLQRALHAKAKRSPNFRFYSLHDKVCRTDVLQVAYQRCWRNRGVAGIDGQTFENIKKYGEARWLGELAEELRKKTYGPSAVRRVWIPKANGK